jgi:hypothetical protein
MAIRFTRVKASNPGKGRKRSGKRRSARNPFGGGGAMALDLAPTVLGAAGAIAVAAFANNAKFFEKYRNENPRVAAVIPAGVTFGAGWALRKYGKGGMAEKVGKALQVFAIFGGVNALAGAAIRGAVVKKPELGATTTTTTTPTTPPAPGGNGLYFERGDLHQMSGSYFDRSDIAGSLTTF